MKQSLNPTNKSQLHLFFFQNTPAQKTKQKKTRKANMLSLLKFKAEKRSYIQVSP